MARKHHRVSNRMLLVWLTLAGLIVLMTPQKITSRVQGAFTTVFHFPLRVGRAISLNARTVDRPDYNFNSRQIEYENHIANLAAELAEKQDQLEFLSGMRMRNSTLDGAALLTSDVISANLEGSQNELIINRGENDGVAAGQFVLGQNCIVGKVTQVYSRQAHVTLITDSTSQLPVTACNMDKGAMFGCGNGQAIIRWSKVKLQRGENVMIQKHPGFLDSPMIVGRVGEVSRNAQNALLWDITVVPACDVAMLPSVMVIVMNPPN